MNIFTTLAQSSQYYTTYDATTGTTSTVEPAFVALVGAFFLFSIVFSVVVYIFFAICLMKIFAKAGVKPWIAWVPFYNTWKMLQIGGQPGIWAVLAIIPFVNIISAVFIYIAMYHIGKKLGKGGEFVLWGIFLPYVWYPWLAFDKSIWNDAASTAPSLAK